MSTDHPSRYLGRDDAFVLTTLDGSNTLFSKSYSAAYHSTRGAVSESRHVFIQNGIGLLKHLPVISILEIGFGTGLNAFLAFLYSLKNQITIHYTGIETVEIDMALVAQLNYPDYLAASRLNEIFLKMHREEKFAINNFEFNKHTSPDQLNDAQKFDCIFFDAFDPSAHPEMWEQEIFDRLFNFTNEKGCLVTYCAQGEVRRRMEKSGFRVKRIPGAPGKRQMIQARKG